MWAPYTGRDNKGTKQETLPSVPSTFNTDNIQTPKESAHSFTKRLPSNPEKKKNGLGRRPDGSPSLMCYVPPSNSPLSVVPSFVLPSREPPPDSPQVYFVPPSLLTRSTVLLPQNPCVLHSRILFYLLSHSPSSAASIEGIEHRPPASFKFTFSSSHHSVWNINPIYWRSPVNTKCHLCTNP